MEHGGSEVKSGFQIYFSDLVDFSHARTIEEAIQDYQPAIRKQIIAVIHADAMPGTLPVESKIAFIAIKTRVMRRAPPLARQRGKVAI